VTADPHWLEWHAHYEDEGSFLSRRLVIVQRRITDALDARPPGPIRVVSMCAGPGRDLLGVLRTHPRAADVDARLVELHPDLAAAAREAALGLPARVGVVEGDAGATDVYEGAVPVDLVLACGVFGNVSDEDVRRTIHEFPHLCAPGAVVIWTRHRKEPDLTPSVRSWFAEAGFEELAFDTEEGAFFSVGTHALAGPPLGFRSHRTMFRFFGLGLEAHS